MRSRQSLLQSLPLATTAEALRNGRIDLHDHIDQVCDRIETVDPEIQALLPEPNRRVRLQDEAATLRLRWPDPANRPPLFGALVGVKDIYHVAGFSTGAGTKLPPSLFAGPEAESVTTLRRAGALILGKTVTTEFAYAEPGPTRNPHNPQHTPGGSSSGSAAAVAAGFCPLALGTQTIGSTIRPAAFCGIIGFKPSFGRIATAGIVAFSSSADHVGLFCQDIDGVVLAASVLCRDWRSTEPAPAADEKNRPVLGVPEGAYLAQASCDALAALESQLVRLQKAGYTIRRVPALDDISDIAKRHTRMIAAEMARLHQAWFAKHGPLYRLRTAALIREGQSVSPEELAAARASRLALRTDLDRLRKQHRIDLWVCPAATGPAPAGLGYTGDPAMNLPWTHAGLPAITIPAGRTVHGLPLGLQLAAGFQQDELLLNVTRGIAATLE